ncbi:conserved hypothetical protein [Ricinus communis]|uniref:Uncharacterized protein n=1 Tax=Ricinus communis TaxID=3988 RepID=B9TJ71_RICCO|nr:conserved hypothetical protein [Ricinus communis]
MSGRCARRAPAVVHGAEWVRHGHRGHRHRFLALFADKAAAHRVIHLGDAATILAGQGETHAVRVFGQRLGHVEHQVRAALEWHRVLAEQRQLAGRLGFRQLRVDACRHHVLRRFAHQPKQHRLVGGVADAGQGERAIQFGLDLGHVIQRSVVQQKPARGNHRPHGMGTRRADADLE